MNETSTQAKADARRRDERRRHTAHRASGWRTAERDPVPCGTCGIAGADSASYRSLRLRPLHVPSGSSWVEASGTRCHVDRWETGSARGRPNPVDLIVRAHEGRVAHSFRSGLAAWSPLRMRFPAGYPVVMAEDVRISPQPASRPVICGDAHLGNFGFYASPERNLVIDLNDFDEAHPGAWEWDLRRLVASIWVAGRQNGSTEAQCGSRSAPASPRAVRKCSSWPMSHCCCVPTSGWT